jgi:Ca2+-binding EF-hand superfamily protein
VERELLTPGKGENMSAISPAQLNAMAISLGSSSGQSASAVPDSILKAAAKKYIKENDADKDGVLSQDEVTWSQEAFEKADADGSGAVDQGEIKTALQGDENTVYRLVAGKNVKLQTYSLIRTALASI